MKNQKGNVLIISLVVIFGLVAIIGYNIVKQSNTQMSVPQNQETQQQTVQKVTNDSAKTTSLSAVCTWSLVKSSGIGVGGITWIISASGGSGNYKYKWTLLGDPLDYGAGSSTASSWTVYYKTYGGKTADVTVSDGSKTFYSSCSTVISSSSLTTDQSQKAVDLLRSFKVDFSILPNVDVALRGGQCSFANAQAKSADLTSLQTKEVMDLLNSLKANSTTISNFQDALKGASCNFKD